MNSKDLAFFQNIINQIALYCAGEEISNEESIAQAERQRQAFSLYKKNTVETVLAEALKLNDQNCQFWTAKEVESLPLLKELKYRKFKGLHQFRYRRNGYDVAFTAKRFIDAKQKARAFIYELKSKGVEKKQVANSLSKIAELWFSERERHVDQSTQRGYFSVYRNHIEPRFGSKDVAKILPMHLQPFFNELHDSKGKTCENAKIILNGIFKFAVANRFCPTNPMLGVLVERHVRKTGQALSFCDVEKFKFEMSEWKDFGCAYLIILNSGIRGAELEHMSFDWQAGTFTVRNAKLKKSQRVNQSNLTRTVPIFAGLKALKSRIESEDWRIPARILSNTFSKRWNGATVKDLRHTFTTRAREAGIENELVNLWTGHLPGRNVTANIYTHFSLEYQLKEAQKLEKI